MKCDLCESSRLTICGFLGLNMVYKCRSYGNRFVETPSLLNIKVESEAQ